MNDLLVIDRNTEEYGATLRLQEELLAKKCDDREMSDMLVLVEHEAVYTAGRGSKVSAEVLPAPVFEVGRGGQITFHGPGQLVAYPIFDLERHEKDVHKFLRKLEAVIIRALAEFGIYGERREGFTGVWVRDKQMQLKKIASIGVGVRRWVSYHGLALNVTTDMKYFHAISPCGQAPEVMTSLAEVFSSDVRPAPEMAEVKGALVEGFEAEFGFVGAAFHAAQPQDSSVDVVPRETRHLQEKKLARPPWLKVKAPGSPQFLETQDVVKKLKLHTVCEEARCPNMGECWSHHTATFMIMGDLCTRRCSFCSVKDGTIHNLVELDQFEPLRVGTAVAELGLEHVVITSVNRDDLPDMGAAHFDQTVRAIRASNPACKIELLIPDMRGRRELVETILQSGFVTVLNHNIETVPRLYKTVRPGANLERSLNVLRWAKEVSPTAVKTKSGIMAGLGETREEVLAVMDLLRAAGVDILTIGQYLQPSQKQLPVQRFVTPEEFEDYRLEGERRGFTHVESAVFVRSSYHAWKHSADVPRPASDKTAELRV